jgi:peptidoglycan/LPS O-acetylase OafA/YrhL
MALTWKDAITTLLALLVIGFSYLMAIGYKIPLITSYRWATVVLLVLGIGMCASGSAASNNQSSWITFASVFGSLAMILILAGIITGSKMVFLALSGTIVVLWLVATLRHFLGF